MNTHANQKIVISLIIMFLLAACGSKPNSMKMIPTTTVISQAAPNSEIQVVITGGHDTNPRDNGRPVVLIASVLGVPSEVFREAFSHVSPAAAGQEPNPIQVRLNKSALLNVLAPYGVTNDLLDAVSNYYRYNRGAGETWPQTPAEAKAILTNGLVTGIEITNPGSGYTTPPIVTILNSDVTATATLSFTTDLNANGSIAAITLDP